MPNIDKVSLAHLPTPLEFLPRLTEALGGPDIWIKRDDQTGLALGGNKTRKLEYLLGDALTSGADTIVTAGAIQSNHCRQTAAAAAKLGLDCHLVLGSEPPDTVTGNLLLDQLFGAKLHWAGRERRGEPLSELVSELKAQGRSPYLVPYGGSNPIGALGYVEAIKELKQQNGPEFSHILFASCSGGTHAGMLAGQAKYGLNSKILGIRIDKQDPMDGPYEQQLTKLTQQTTRLLTPEVTTDKVQLNNDYMAGGYAVLGQQEVEAIQMLARTEGILLDPVYSGRAFAGLVDLVQQGFFDSDKPVLFWHTGGSPALFAYHQQLSA
ncbi:1-aminocyclopropane-1-carboxylate deaminase [Saliniradius amylolyticus]|uniref:1-aminocyclopropane-1-carboxylate deaminase n=1 Tax=Saliniradius amylolyticus TaxID=2183582 RepID=A0A2S2E288_9ALTE|nr:D-cysteine desulfhydrase family protein [Saliniradius amylolyticus]AWL11753.1 1-aminocyclopropane-1-carboxylate deaminase [Saliniradius amylolyticus]